MFNPDKPITKEKDEKLNRLNFIKNLSNAINHYDNQECLVIGLLGEWGSGKTSILNLAMNGINKNREIFRYNPWIFSEENDLILNFFIELLEIIQKIESNNEDNQELVETTKELSKNITQYLKKFFNKSTISGNITLLHGISIGGSFTPNWEEKSLEESLGDLKEKINQGLEKLDKKIIIIIDDIDRLSDNEVKQIFKLVKTVADFRNTIYILSFDKKMVTKSLDRVQTYSPEKYLEKIVQIQIEIPKIEKSKLEDFLESELRNVLNIDSGLSEEELITISYNLKPFISNIRDVNRYINHLKFYLPFLKEDVNTSDYLMILALQLFENEIYNEIKNNKRVFVGTNSFDREEKELIRKNINELISKKNKKLKENEIKNILYYLFPKLTASYGSDWLSTWRQELKICHPDYFDKYFTLSIPETELSQLELNILFNYDNYDNIKEKVFEFDKKGKSRELMEKIIHFHEKIPEKNIKNFIKLIIENGDILNISYKGFSHDESYLTSIIISELLKKLEHEKRFEILKSIISNLDKNIFTIIAFLKLEKLTIEKHENEPNAEEFIVLTQEEIEKINGIILEKIKRLTEKNRLLDCYNLDVILDYWASIENKDIVSEFFESCLTNEENIIKIIQGFETKTSSQNLSEPFARIHTRFTFSVLEKFINLEEFKNTILSMNNDDNKYLDYFIEELESYINEYPPE